MKRRCSLIIFLVIAGVFSFGLVLSRSQPALPQLPVGVTPQPMLENYLKFDAEEKTVTVTNGAPEGYFTFSVTNVSSEDITIYGAEGSCHCTVAQLPPTPWKLSPKQSGEFSATMQMAGTPPGASKTKTLTVTADKGTLVLYVTTKVLPEPAVMTETDRTNNLKMAGADRQAVFKGDCIQCHATPARDATGREKMGHDLYAAVCMVCHETAHQASFVPNLHRLPEPTSAEFWRNWIMHGKPGTLMPAFAKVEGGILSDAQIDSLVQYLSATIPARPMRVGAPSPLNVVK